MTAPLEVHQTASLSDYLLDRPNDRRAALLYTLKCNLRCSHCLVGSSPERSERMSLDEAKQLVGEAREAGIEVFYLTGGEVFLYWKQLLELVEHITALGGASVVETNGYWARTDAETERRLRMLVERGMACIALSLDAYHREESGLDRSLRIAEIAREMKLPCRVTVVASPDASVDEAIVADLRSRDIPYFYEGLMTIGRGQDVGGDAPPALDMTCESIGWTILPDGDTFGCFGASDDNTLLKQTPLYAGNALEDPAGTLRSERTRLFANAIDEFGHDFLVELLRECPEASVPERGSHGSICSFCTAMLSDESNVRWLEARLRDLAAG